MNKYSVDWTENELRDEEKLNVFFEDVYENREKGDIVIDSTIDSEKLLFDLLNCHTKHDGREINEYEREAILDSAIKLIDAVHNDLLLRYV